MLSSVKQANQKQRSRVHPYKQCYDWSVALRTKFSFGVAVLSIKCLNGVVVDKGGRMKAEHKDSC